MAKRGKKKRFLTINTNIIKLTFVCALLFLSIAVLFITSVSNRQPSTVNTNAQEHSCNTSVKDVTYYPSSTTCLVIADKEEDISCALSANKEYPESNASCEHFYTHQQEGSGLYYLYFNCNKTSPPEGENFSLVASLDTKTCKNEWRTEQWLSFEDSMASTLSKEDLLPKTPKATAVPPTDLPKSKPVKVYTEDSKASGLINNETKEHINKIWQKGNELGNDPRKLSKVGDSITASGEFLSDLGDPAKKNERLSTYEKELRPVINLYRGRLFENSFNRKSIAAVAGWTTSDVLGLPQGKTGKNSPLQREYYDNKPSIAVIMFGTNDLDKEYKTLEDGVNVFEKNYREIIQTSLDLGVIPIISTIPDRVDNPKNKDRYKAYNMVITDLAREYKIPLIKYGEEMMMEKRLKTAFSSDKVHPRSYPGKGSPESNSVTFFETALNYGYNLRNFMTLQMLAEVKNSIPELQKL